MEESEKDGKKQFVVLSFEKAHEDILAILKKVKSFKKDSHKKFKPEVLDIIVPKKRTSVVSTQQIVPSSKRKAEMLPLEDYYLTDEKLRVIFFLPFILIFQQFIPPDVDQNLVLKAQALDSKITEPVSKLIFSYGLETTINILSGENIHDLFLEELRRKKPRTIDSNKVSSTETSEQPEPSQP